MMRRNLSDNWTLTILGENVYNIPEKPIGTKVPSTVYGTLLDKGLMPDPHFRDNELTAMKLMENDFVYETDFSVSEKERAGERLFLRFDGIDTLADIYLGQELLGSRYYLPGDGDRGGHGLSFEGASSLPHAFHCRRK